jgi:hypothetical protein
MGAQVLGAPRESEETNPFCGNFIIPVCRMFLVQLLVRLPRNSVANFSPPC